MSTEKPKCTWCEDLSIGEVELEAAKFAKDKRTGVKVEKKPALRVPACTKHIKILDWQTPFYMCGCHYIKDEIQCPKHLRQLREPWRTQQKKVSIKHSHVEKKETQGFVVK